MYTYRSLERATSAVLMKEVVDFNQLRHSPKTDVIDDCRLTSSTLLANYLSIGYWEISVSQKIN